MNCRGLNTPAVVASEMMSAAARMSEYVSGERWTAGDDTRLQHHGPDLTRISGKCVA